MTVPPHRGYMGKSGFPVPIDYNDHSLNAGGIAQTQGGNHGLCGDPYSDSTPRAHETGGMYGLFPSLGVSSYIYANYLALLINGNFVYVEKSHRQMLCSCIYH